MIEPGGQAEPREAMSAMTAADFLRALRARDVHCWAEGGRLRLNAPRGALTPELQELLARRRDEIVSHLRTSQGLPPVPELSAAPRGRTRLPLSFAQERLWFLQKLEPQSAAYNLQADVSFRGPLDLPAVEKMLSELLRRHEPLRTRFEEREGRPEQVILPPAPVPLPVVDLATLGDDERRREWARLATEEVRRPFDLERGPVFRAVLVRVGPDDHHLLVTQHHVVTDGWSIAVLVEEATALYEAFAAGRPSPLAEPRLQYADFAWWQRQWMRGDVLERLLEHWRERLRGAPPTLDLPTDRPRPPVQTFAGAELTFELDRALSDGVRALGREAGATPFMTLLAAFDVVLARHSGQDDVIVGTANGNRSLVETERMLGFFVNTVVLRTDLSGDPTVRELLARVRRTALDAQTHGDLPFEKLVDDLKPERNLSRSPIFQVLFVLQNTPLQGYAGNGSGVTGDRATAAFELSLYLVETERGFSGTFEYNTDLFDRDTIERLARHYRHALEGMVADPDRRLSAISLLGEAERRLVLSTWNETARAIPTQLAHEQVAAQAARTPEAVAVLSGSATLTYAQLADRADRLARRLRAAGVRPGALVGLCLERSTEMVVALLAILEAGGAYVPLDPAYPRERLALMLEDAGPAVIVTERGLRDRLPPGGWAIVLAEDDGREGGEGAAGVPRPRGGALPDDLAYVIFTSGSTGRPKAVGVTHRALSNVLASVGERTGLSRSDVLLAVTTLSFDIATLEILLPLLTGARVVLSSREAAADPAALAALLETAGVTVMQATPATWRMLVGSGWPGKAGLTVVSGGEALSPELARALAERCGSVWNMYGPSETAIYSVVHAVRPPSGIVPIGRPLANTRVYVLGPGLEPVPLGVAGELYIGGSGVARGYLGRPELTAERFLPDPFSGEPGARLYRTGDLARLRKDAALEYLGRVDHQVKIRGFRIEPGEVEAALRRHPTVRDCVVVAREEGGGDRRLVAYVACDTRQEARVSELRRFLSGLLPEFMVPSAFVLLPGLPRTASGKVDRRALPDADAGRHGLDSAYVPPRDPVEQTVAGIWHEVLGREHVGIHDSFFDLGGHSLSVTQVLARLQDAFGVQVPLRRMFESPTVAGLAESVRAALRDGAAAETHSLVPLPRGDDLPLSFAQERLWFLDRLEEGDAVYNMPAALHLHGPLAEEALRASLAEIVRRHESLRTTFEDVDGRPVQRIQPAESFVFPCTDLTDLPEEARGAAAGRLAHEEARSPFDLARGPLFRCRLVRLAPEQHLLLATLHHSIADGWSLGVLSQELGTLYAAFARGEPSPLPEPPLQYADFARWQRSWMRGERRERQLAYWRRKLGGVKTLDLPLDRARSDMQTFRGATYLFRIPGPLAAAARALGRAERATSFMTLMAAFETLLHRVCGQDDVAVGTPVAGRSRTELEGLIGLFASTLVLRTDFGGDPTFREALARVRETALEAYTNQDVPFEALVEDLRPERNPSVHPLFQVMFAMQDAPAPPLALPGLALQPVGVETGTSRFDLSLFVAESPDGFSAVVEYNTDLFDRGTIERLAGSFLVLLEGAVAAPDRRVSSLPLLTDADRRNVLVGWNDTARPLPAEACLHRLVEAQAARRPDVVAVAFEGETLTYGALDEKANRLARRLRSLGAAPETMVGVALERSLDMVVGLLAVLKAGAAYLPLDPAYPDERLAFMCEDSGLRILLTQASLRDRFASAPAVVCVDEHDEGGGEEPEARPAVASRDNLAYVLYTSGSTGRPKGVQVPHRAVANLLASMAEQPGFAAGDVMLAVTTLSFDIAALEIFLPLVTGGRVELVGRDAAADGRELSRRLAASGATAMQATPATWRLLLEAGWSGGPLKALCGGEALPGDLAQALLDRGVALYSLYGPTETTIWSAVEPVERAVPVTPLGRPVANTELYVLDRRAGPLPVGVPGELFIGGEGVARGYAGRPDLTAERFLPDPFGRHPGARLYRTGDLVRRLPDGTLEFLGRIDNQVKVRGFRIELGEIEATLLEQDSVRAAVVLARDGAPDRQLVAHVVFGSGEVPTITQLRARLRETLPSYMVPSSFVVLDSLPLTPNGKVDRRALARLAGTQSADEDGGVEPRTPLERRIAEAWKDALGIGRVSVHDNFFDIGGHSLLSMRVVARLEKELGVRLGPRDLIFQTLGQLAATLEERLTLVAGERGRRA